MRKRPGSKRPIRAGGTIRKCGKNSLGVPLTLTKIESNVIMGPVICINLGTAILKISVLVQNNGDAYWDAYLRAGYIYT